MMIDLRTTQNQVNDYGDFWLKNQMWNNIDDPKKPYHKKRIEVILRHIEGEKILDIACATGEITKLIRNHCKPKRIVGYEGSQAVVEKGKELHPDIEWIHGLVEALPFARDEFDWINASEIIEHIRDPEGLISRIAEIARKGAIISTPSNFVLDPGHVALFTPTALEEMAKRYFKSVEIIVVPRIILAICKTPRAIPLKPKHSKVSLRIFITTYDRPDLLLALLRQIDQMSNGFAVKTTIVDDASEQDYSAIRSWAKAHRGFEYRRIALNRGKTGYWQTQNECFAQIKREKKYDFYFFIPDDTILADDFFNQCLVHWNRISDSSKIAFHTLVDKRTSQSLWTAVKTRGVEFDGESYWKAGWLECNWYMATWKLYDLLDFHINPPDSHRWDGMPGRSSGVASDMSIRLAKTPFRAFAPIGSLSEHVHGDSKMHPEERRRHPIKAVGFSGVAGREPVYASMATRPGRESLLEETIASILPQVNQLHICLNGYERIPAYLKKDSKIKAMIPPEDYGARGKFFWVDKISGYHVVCDDDVIYPSDFVEKVIGKVREKKRRVVVGAHGVAFIQPIVSYTTSRVIWYYDQEIINDQAVDVIGTGSCGFHTIVFEKWGAKVFPAIASNNMCDVYFGRLCQKLSTPRIVVSHPKGWLDHRPSPDAKSIYDMYGGGLLAKEQTRICQETWGRKPEGDAVIFNSGIGNFVMLTPLLQQLDRPTIYCPPSVEYEEAIRSISLWPVVPKDLKLTDLKLLHRRVFPLYTWKENIIDDPSFHTRPYPKWKSGLHEVDSLLSALPGAAQLNTAIKTRRVSSIREEGKRLIVLCNGANPAWKAKQWPVKSWIELAKRLTQDFRNQVVFVGDDDGEKACGKAIKKGCPPVQNLVGKMTLAETADVISQCDLMVTTDSGLMHIADALFKPTIAIWGPTSWTKNRPWNTRDRAVKVEGSGAGCEHYPCFLKRGAGHVRACKKPVCMEAVTVDMVHGAIKAHFESSPALTADIFYEGRKYDMAGLYPEDLLFRRWREEKIFYEIEVLEFLRSVNSEATIIDVGANLGNHAVYLLNETTCSNLVAIEPVPEFHEVLTRNLTQNNPLNKRFRTINAAVGDTNGTTRMAKISRQNTGGTQMKGNGREVPQITLDSLDIDHVAAIKIDVEGMEIYVLRGAVEILKRDKPALVVESSTAKALQAIAALLTPLGYKNEGRLGPQTPTYAWRA